MQLIDLVRGRWVAVVGIPLVAAVVAGLLAYSMTEREYTATARVAVAQILPRDASSFQIDPVLADFRAVIVSDDVASAVVDATHLPAASVVGQVTAVGAEGGVVVTFTAPSAVGAKDGLEAAVRRGLLIVAQDQQAQAKVEAAAARSEVDRTNAESKSLTERTKIADAAVEYQQRLTDLLALRNQAATGDAATQARLSPIILQKAAELDTVGAVLATARQVDAASASAATALADAQSAVALVTARIDAIEAGSSVTRSLQTTPASRVGVLAQAVVGAFVLTAAVVVLLLWRRTWTGRIPGVDDELDEPELDGSEAAGDDEVPDPGASGADDHAVAGRP